MVSNDVMSWCQMMWCYCFKWQDAMVSDDRMSWCQSTGCCGVRWQDVVMSGCQMTWCHNVKSSCCFQWVTCPSDTTYWFKSYIRILLTDLSVYAQKLLSLNWYMEMLASTIDIFCDAILLLFFKQMKLSIKWFVYMHMYI